MMDPISQAKFDEVTSRDPREIAKDKDALKFLRSRRAYLRPEQKEVFKELLKGFEQFDMTPEQRKEFEAETKRLEIEAKKAEEEIARQTKSIKESQNPESVELEEKAKEAIAEEEEPKAKKSKK